MRLFKLAKNVFSFQGSDTILLTTLEVLCVQNMCHNDTTMRGG